MTRRLIAAALLATALLMSVLVAPTQAAVPSKQQWLTDTAHAMSGSRAWLHDRVAKGGRGLTVNLDIDNTALATHYDRGHATPVVLRFAQYAASLGVRVVFNTGRNQSELRQAVAGLRRSGYAVGGICGRRTGESLSTSKQRCRQYFVDKGYRIVANVGNRSTDFVGGNYERAYRLPNYGNQLG